MGLLTRTRRAPTADEIASINAKLKAVEEALPAPAEQTRAIPTE